MAYRSPDPALRVVKREQFVLFCAVTRPPAAKTFRDKDSRRAHPPVDMTMTDPYPAQVAGRSLRGHGEGDLITGA
jgi:hypothetical protein